MKLIYLALLLVLTLQLHLYEHAGLNSLAGKTFKITSNSADVDAINNIDVVFAGSTLSFKGCGKNTGTYAVNRLYFFAGNIVSTPNFCTENNDGVVRDLLTNSRQYQFKNNILILKDQNEKVTLTLTLKQ